ncbi:MAG: hypothetical protein M3340_00495 [Actinomycetota bacterium]|nr:hypothetical protein [Actinomycetota bacterium]
MVALTALLLAAYVPACGDDDGDSGSTSTEPSGYTGSGGYSEPSGYTGPGGYSEPGGYSDPPPADPYAQYYEDELLSAPTDAPPPPLPEPALESLVDELAAIIRINQAAARALTSASGYAVEPAGVAGVVDVACAQGGQAAADELVRIAPGVDLAVLPNVNELAGEIADVCDDQSTADAFSSAALSHLISNGAQPETVTAPSEEFSLLNEAACKGLKAGLANRINKWLRIRGAGRFGVSLALGAALTDCRDTLGTILDGL